MKVIDLFNKMENGKEIPNKIKLQCVNSITNKNCIYKFSPLEECYVNIDGNLLTDATCFSTLLHLEIEIIEEPKEELEEIELLKYNEEYSYDFNIARLYKMCEQLIANQNKIIRELKANKGNE